MSTIIRRQRVTWTSVDNRIINDTRLGIKALGLLVYMLSKPNDWSFSQDQLGATWGEGRESMRSMMRKLMECGYVRREYVHDASGRIKTVTIVSELPEDGSSDDRANRPTGKPTVGSPVSIVTTDEDKVLKEVKTEPPPRARKVREEKTMTEWLESLSDTEDAISQDDPIFTRGIPSDMIETAWNVFRDRYTTDDNNKTKRYKDWRQTFRNAIDNNWLKLWWIDGSGAYQLTTAGKQAAARFGG